MSQPNSEPLNTDALNSNLSQKSLRSGLITFAAQPLKLFLGIGSTAILARILTPEDFGLLAMVMPVFLLVDSLSNFGLETALVQQETLNPQLVNILFWRSLKINAGLIAVTGLLAPVVAMLYQEQRVTGIIIGLSVGAFSVCVASLHKSLLKRQMKFGTLTAIELISLLVSTAVAITAAIIGWGYWALVLQLVVMQLVQSLAQWWICGWQPDKYSRADRLDPELKSILSYSQHLTGFRFLTRIGMHLDRILIGYISGAGASGLYQVAYKWAYFPFEQVYFPLFDVAVSSLSRVQHDPKLYRLYAKRGLTPIFAFCLPALTFSFIEASNLILLLLGEQWSEAIPLFRLLAIAVYAVSMYRVTKWLYVSAGQTQQQFRWGLIHTPIMIAAVAVGANWGAYGVAVGYTLGTCVLTIPSVAYCLRYSVLRWQDFIGAVWRPIAASLLAGIALFYARDFIIGDRLFIEFAWRWATYSLLYILLWLLLPGGRASILEIFKSLKIIK